MIVCSCNVLSDKDIAAAIEAGARRPAAVYAHKECRPECGKCAGNICRLLKQKGVACAPEKPCALENASENPAVLPAEAVFAADLPALNDADAKTAA